MAGLEPSPENIELAKENNSLLMCYDKLEIDKIFEKVTECIDKHIEDTIFSTEDIKDNFRARFVKLYADVLSENIQISDEAAAGDDYSSQGQSGVIVNEMKEKHYNEILAPELDRAIVATVSHRKTRPLLCAKQLAKQCSYEHTTESKGEVVLEPSVSLTTAIECSNHSHVTANIVQGFSSVSALSMSYPQAIEDVCDLETVHHMQSSIGRSAVDCVVYGAHRTADLAPDPTLGPDGDEVRRHNLLKGFVFSE